MPNLALGTLRDVGLHGVCGRGPSTAVRLRTHAGERPLGVRTVPPTHPAVGPAPQWGRSVGEGLPCVAVVGAHTHLEMVPCGSHEECAAGKSCACTASAPPYTSRASTPSPPALPGLTSTHRSGHVLGPWCVLQVPVGAWAPAAAMARAWGLVHLPPDRESAARVLNTSKPASRPSAPQATP